MRIAAAPVIAATSLLLASCGEASSETAAEPAPTVTVTVTAEPEPAPTVTVTAEPVAEPEPTSEPTADEESASNGDTQTIGDWDVQLLRATARDDEVVMNLTVTYNGDETGNPFFDMNIHVTGNDNVQHEEACGGSDSDWVDAPTLNPGGSTSFEVCRTVPPGAADGDASIEVSLLSFDDDGSAVFPL